MASLKQFIADSKSYFSRLTGEPDWVDDPQINLHEAADELRLILGNADPLSVPVIDLPTTDAQVRAITGLGDNAQPPAIDLETLSGQVKAITGEAANSTAPLISLKTTSGQIIAITGKADNGIEPAITLEATSSQIKAITGRSLDISPPVISLATASTQIQAITGKADSTTPPTISLDAAYGHIQATNAHGQSGFATTAQALGTASPGTATTVSRGDHVHPMPNAAQVGAAASYHTHSVSQITDLTSALGGYAQLNQINSFTAAQSISRAGSGGVLDLKTDGALRASFYAENNYFGFVPASSYGTLAWASRLVYSYSLGKWVIGNDTDANAAVATVGDMAGSFAPVAGSYTQTFSVANATQNYHALNLQTGNGLYAPKAGSIYQPFAASVIDFGANGASTGIRNGNHAVTFSTNLLLETAGVVKVVSKWNSSAMMDVYCKNLNADGTWYYSDERLKRKIRRRTDLNAASSLRALAQEGIIEFAMLEDAEDAPLRVGFSAQSIAALAGTASVTIEDDQLGHKLGWDLGAMMAMVVDAIASLDKRLDAIEERIQRPES